MSQVHPRARTTPRTRAEIKASPATVTALAERYNITVSTARKWKLREDPQDRSHRPHKLSTTLTPAQEVLAVELRRTLLLPLDDLLAVVREFINAAVSRSGLDRCLRRHGVLLQQKARIDLTPAGFMTIDAKTVLCEINISGARLLGAERDNLLGLALANLLTARGADTLQTLMANARDGLTPHTGELQLPPHHGATPADRPGDA
mgnify:FL=1